MQHISNKNKRFVKRNFKQLSIEEIGRKTGLKPQVIRSLIDGYTAKKPGRDRDHSLKPLGDHGVSHKWSGYLIGMVAIFMLTILVYTPALKNNFVWDDILYVSDNTLIRSLSIDSLYEMLTSFHAGNWHPLTWLSLAIDYAFWGLNPFGYHLTNIILHGFNTLLVFLLVIRLVLKAEKANGMSSAPKMPLLISTQSLIVASITALLFGLHPLHVESVAWAAERKDLLCTFFVLLSILAYLSYTSSVLKSPRWIWFTTCLLLFIFALMSKPMAVTFPVILLLLDLYPLRRVEPYLTGNLSLLLEKVSFFVLSIGSGVITIMAQQAGEAIRSLALFSLGARLLNAVRSFIFYLEKIIVPLKLVPLYPFPLDIYWLDLPYPFSALLFLAITGGCVWVAKRGSYLLLVLWLYYVITLIPVIGIIQVGIQAAADRYTYLPGLSIFLLIGVGVSWSYERVVLTKHKGIGAGSLWAVVFIIMFFLGQLTIKQIKVWQNPEVFWSYVINTFPETIPKAHYNLGNIYFKKGRLNEAISEYKKALAINPHHAKVHNNLGATYYKKDMFDEAISEHKKALAINPNHAGAQSNLGAAYTKKGMLDEAISEYKKAIAIDPNLAEAHYNLSVLYYYKGNYKLAIVQCDKAVEIGLSVDPKLLALLKPYR